MKHRKLSRIFAFGALLFMLLGVTAPASAVTTPGPSRALPAASSVQQRIDDSSDYVDLSKVYGVYLPTTRWQVGSSSFHGRFDQFLQTNVIAFSQRTIAESQGMMFGNSLYGFTQGILDFSLHLQPLNLLGAQADKVAAQIGNALYKDSPVLAGIIVVIVAGSIFKMRTGVRPWKKIITAAGLVALFALMVVGAGASTMDGGTFNPGFGSPGWFATKINASVTSLASVPAQALVTANASSAGSAAEGSGCNTYLKNMVTSYNSVFSDSSMNSGTIPRIISSLWEGSGLTVWKQTQFGSVEYDMNNHATYGDEVFCHQLDWQSKVKPDDQAAMTFGSAEAAAKTGYKPESAAWGAADNDQQDRSLVAWAACDVQENGTFTVRQGFKSDKDGGEWVGTEDCEGWWHGDQNADLDAFNVSGSDSAPFDKTEDPAVINFLSTLHGNDNNAGLTLIWTYNVSALLIMLVFGGLGIAVVIAKFAGVLMVITVFFVLLMSLLSKQDMFGRLGQFVKTYFGYTVFAFGATLILAMVTIMSKMISDTGTAVFGAGQMMALIWTGLSPILACWLLHMIFTKMFKVPSVFKPSSAMAWGAAGGAAGGALGSAFMNRHENRAANFAKKVARRTGGKAASYASGGLKSLRGPGGRAQRPGMMKPGGGGIGGGGGSTPAMADGGAEDLGGAAFSNGVPGFDSKSVAAAQTIASGARFSGKQLRDMKFDKQTLHDAKLLAKGYDPTMPLGPQRSAALGHGLGMATRKTIDTVSAGRHALAVPFTTAGRSAIRERSAATLGSMRTGIQTANERTREYAKMMHDDPATTLALSAQRAGHAVGSAARATGHVAAKAATSQPVKAAAKIGTGMAIGAVFAGPVGMVAGAAAGAGRAHRAINIQHTKRDAAAITALAAHVDKQKKQQQADHKQAHKQASEASDAPAASAKH